MQAFITESSLENPIIASVHLSCVEFSYKGPQIYSLDFSFVTQRDIFWDLVFIYTFEFIDYSIL